MSNINTKIKTLFNNVIGNGLLVGVEYCNLIFKVGNKQVTIQIKWYEDNYNLNAVYDTIESFKNFNLELHSNDKFPGIDIITSSGFTYPVIFDNDVEWAKAIESINNLLIEFQKNELEEILYESWQ